MVHLILLGASNSHSDLLNYVKITPNGDIYSEFKLNEMINKIEGKVINQTDKAVLINFEDKTEVWIPKSTIHSPYNITISSSQLFMIENWVLKKNNLDHLISNNYYPK